MSTQPIDTSKLPMALAPLYVLLNRLTGHTDKGRMLYGLRLELFPAMARVQGRKDYPVLRMLVPALGCRPSDAGSGYRAAKNRNTSVAHGGKSTDVLCLKNMAGGKDTLAETKVVTTENKIYSRCGGLLYGNHAVSKLLGVFQHYHGIGSCG